jgi:hypothetical protein
VVRERPGTLRLEGQGGVVRERPGMLRLKGQVWESAAFLAASFEDMCLIAH